MLALYLHRTPLISSFLSKVDAFTDLMDVATPLVPTPINLAFYFFSFFSYHIWLIETPTGEGAPEEDGSPPAHEHLPASGDRPDAAGHRAGAQHLDGSQAGHRRYHHHEREPAGRAGLHVRRAHPSPLDEGAFRELRSTDSLTFTGFTLHVQEHFTCS